MPGSIHPPRQVRLYCGGELLQEQLLWPGQAVTIGRQPRDHTFVLPCPELPWRSELISPLDEGWIVRAQELWHITYEDAPDSPLDEDRWVTCLLGLQLSWRGYLITIAQAPEQSISTQVIVPSAQRPLRLQAPSPTICAVMVGLAFLQISSAAKLRAQPLPWSVESLSWDNPHVVQSPKHQGQQLPSIHEALKAKDPSALERALKTASSTPEQAPPLKTESSLEEPQQLPTPTLRIMAASNPSPITAEHKRWRPAPPRRCEAWGCDPWFEQALGARLVARTRAQTPAIQRCYQQALKSDPARQGKLRVHLSMKLHTSSWKVASASSTQDERLGVELGTCISEQLARMIIPRSSTDSTHSSPQELELSFVFVPSVSQSSP